MTRMNHKGPEEQGPKTGRMLGRCKKTAAEEKQMGMLGKGMGKRRHAGGGMGKGKRLKYDEPK